MRIVIAPDKFKGSLSAPEVGEYLKVGILDALPEAEVSVVPMCDGGEGTLQAALANGFNRVDTEVTGPLGKPVRAGIAVCEDEAVIEMAVASGLDLIPPQEREPLRASSRGTGELIRAALDAGARRIVLGVGGSASSDAGAGMLSALGARILDAQGHELADGGGALKDVALIDLSDLDARLEDTDVLLASDVDHVLLGPDGAARVFAPQKGADEDQVEELERGLEAFSRVLHGGIGGPDFALLPGSGAAGGVGFAALAALGAVRRPGVEVAMEFTGLREHLVGADLVLTGEGSFDEQTLGGKTPMGVLQLAERLGLPVVMVCGRSAWPDVSWRHMGFAQCLSVIDLAGSAEASIREAGPHLRTIGARLGRSWRRGDFADSP